MTRRLQFVAAVLVLFFLAGTLSVFAACLPQDAEAMPEHCGPNCPMMKMHAPSTPMTVQAMPQGTSCCDLSSSKPVPASAVQSPSDRVSLSAPTATAQSFALVLPAPRAESRDAVPRSTSSAPQAVFCTFLI